MLEIKLLFVLTLCSTIVGRQCVLSGNTTSAVQSGFGFEMIMTKLQYLEDRWAEREQSIEKFCELICKKEPTMQHNAKNDSNKVSDHVYRSCAEVSSSGIYPIQPDKCFKEPITVYCDQEYESGGWIVIQHRFNGSTNFDRNWQEYKNGFGNLDGEFWLGLDRIHQLTVSRPHELIVLLEDFKGSKVYAKYDQFEIGTEDEKYAIKKLGNYLGTAGDKMTYLKGMKFVTFDTLNDVSYLSCVAQWSGGWWSSMCHNSNLNGRISLYELALMEEDTFRRSLYAPQSSKMMIRPRKV